MNPDRDLALDVAKFEFLWPLAYPIYSKVPFLSSLVKLFVKDEVMSLPHLWEKAASVQMNWVRDSRVHQDFQNGADCKLVSVRTCGYKKKYSAPVTGLHKKTGPLVIACYERKQQKWFFFKVPYDAYRVVKKSSNIEIPFELDGNPRRIPIGKKTLPNWWEFECTFEQLKD
jgi:hypothetical protein